MEAAYSSGAPWLKALIAYLESNVELVRNSLNNLPGIDLVDPEGTFLLWVNFNGLGLGPDELFAFLRNEAQWSVTRGHSFGKQGNGFARVNIACTRAKLETALARLELAVGRLHS
jgi:cystathionine beta-lyase